MEFMSLKLRIPDAWQGRLHSSEVTAWLANYLQRPGPLPADPGAGEARVSLSVPPRAVKILEGLTGETPSSALRRLIASRLYSLPPRLQAVAALPAVLDHVGVAGQSREIQLPPPRARVRARVPAADIFTASLSNDCPVSVVSPQPNGGTGGSFWDDVSTYVVAGLALLAMGLVGWLILEIVDKGVRAGSSWKASWKAPRAPLPSFKPWTPGEGL